MSPGYVYFRLLQSLFPHCFLQIEVLPVPIGSLPWVLPVVCRVVRWWNSPGPSWCVGSPPTSPIQKLVFPARRPVRISMMSARLPPPSPGSVRASPSFASPSRYCRQLSSRCSTFLLVYVPCSKGRSILQGCYHIWDTYLYWPGN